MPKYTINHLLLGVLFDTGRIIGNRGGTEGEIWLRLEILEIRWLSKKEMPELMAFLLSQDLKGPRSIAY